MSEYTTCKHLHDTGGTCNSAAVKDRDYCTYHLRYRARLLRMAQAKIRAAKTDGSAGLLEPALSLSKGPAIKAVCRTGFSLGLASAIGATAGAKSLRQKWIAIATNKMNEMRTI
jgi:hypothetical protein